MNILKAIKAWWKPEVKEASTKATVRFKNGVAIYSYSPAHAGDLMKDTVVCFLAANQDPAARAELLRVGQAMMNVGMYGQHGLAGQQSHFANMGLRDRGIGRLI